MLLGLPECVLGEPERFRMSENEFMTVREVVAYLRLARITVYRLAESKDLPGFKAGRQWRFIKAEIDEWLKWKK